MNTYKKYCPNVFVASCDERYEKGDKIILTTKYGKEHECIVFNYLGKVNDGKHIHSIVRADGFNYQEWAKNKAERIRGYAENASKKSDEYWESSNEGRDFLVLAEPIKIGHHSEKRHRALIERNHKRMDKAMEFKKKSEAYQSRIDYWDSKSNEINLSMPESLEFFTQAYHEAKVIHEMMKNGEIERSHSYSLTYAKKRVNTMKRKLEIAEKLWS